MADPHLFWCWTPRSPPQPISLTNTAILSAGDFRTKKPLKKSMPILPAISRSWNCKEKLTLEWKLKKIRCQSGLKEECRFDWWESFFMLCHPNGPDEVAVTVSGTSPFSPSTHGDLISLFLSILLRQRLVGKYLTSCEAQFICPQWAWEGKPQASRE